MRFSQPCPDTLAQAALRLVGAAPSTGNLECHFSRLQLAYGHLRGRLGLENLSRMSFITDSFVKYVGHPCREEEEDEDEEEGEVVVAVEEVLAC